MVSSVYYDIHCHHFCSLPFITLTFVAVEEILYYIILLYVYIYRYICFPLMCKYNVILCDINVSHRRSSNYINVLLKCGVKMQYELDVYH